MSGQNIPVIHRLLSSWNIFRALHAGILGDVKSIISLHEKLSEVIYTHLQRAEVKDLKILDLGCGQTATQTVLFKTDGADVIGVDVEIPTYKMNFRIFMRVIKTNGVERAIKSLIRHLLFDKKHFSELSSHYGKTILLDQLDIRIMDAASMSFPDNTFDFVYSSRTFEHIGNVTEAIVEVNRVLKPSGIAWIGIDLFPSLSGGHHLDWFSPDQSPSKKVPPWDHLLDNKYPVNTYLNKFRLDNYRKIFHNNINIIGEELTYEGDKILNPWLENILLKKGYAREDLLTRSVAFLCRKNKMDTYTRANDGK